jgi:hypothetical protein
MTEPAAHELAKSVATKLYADEALLAQMTKLLGDAKASGTSVQVATSLVGNLNADKVVVAQNIEGGLKM